MNCEDAFAEQGKQLRARQNDQRDQSLVAGCEPAPSVGAAESRATGADSHDSSDDSRCTHDQCEEALTHLDEFVDGEVDSQRHTNIAAHLHDCPPCQQQYTIEAVVKSLVARSCVDHAPPALRARVVAQLVIARFQITG